MNAQQKFVVLCAALFEDVWVERIADEYDAMPEEFVWEDDAHYEDTLDLIDDIAEREFIRHGGA